MDQLVEQMLAEGADAVCYKPFDVPQLLDDAGATGRGARAEAGRRRRGERHGVRSPLDILVIEDDADTRDNLRDILELDDHRVATAGTAAEALRPRRLGAVRGDHPRPPAPRRDGRAAPAPPQGRGPRRRRDRRHRLRRPPGGDRGPAPGSDRLHPQAAQRRRPPHQPGADRRAAAARPGQGAERGRLPPPGRGRRVHDRHPPARPLDRLLQPVRRAAHRLRRRRGPGPRLPRRCSCPKPTGAASPTEFAAGHRRRARPAASRTRSSAATARAAGWSGTPATCPTTRAGPAILEVGQDITSQAGPGAGAPGRAAGRHRPDGRRPGPREPQRPAAQPGLPGDARPGRPGPARGARPDRPAPEGPGPPPHLYEDVRSYAAPIKLEQHALRPRARSGARPGPTSSPARQGKQAVLREAIDGVDLRCVGRPVPARSRSSATSSITPWPPARRPVVIDGPRRGGRARRPAGDPHRRPRQRPGPRRRSSGTKSSTRSSPPRPRGPAWAWPSPSGSSRPTAARSRSATATGPGPSLPHHPAERTAMTRSLKIAVADDEPDMRDYFQQILPAPGPPGRRRRPGRPRAGRAVPRPQARPGHHRHQDARHGRHRRRRADLPQRPDPGHPRLGLSRPRVHPPGRGRPHPGLPGQADQAGRPRAGDRASPCAGSSSSRPCARRPPT